MVRDQLTAARASWRPVLPAPRPDDGAPGPGRSQADPNRLAGALTGANSSPGIGFDRGIRFGVDEVNKAGGIGGRHLELITRDTQGDPTKAVNDVLAVINQDKIDVLLGPTNSGESLATEPVTARYKVPSLVYGVIDELIDPKKYPYFFRQLPSNRNGPRRHSITCSMC